MFFIFSIIGNVIIPTDFYIFQRGGSTTNQYISVYILWGSGWYPCQQVCAENAESIFMQLQFIASIMQSIHHMIGSYDPNPGLQM